MKNKKMVATLASLCLIVVAVVAAVVGVLAAVQQNVHATFTVTYTAKNVHAAVTLKSKGPTLSTSTRSIYKIDDDEDAETPDVEAWETYSSTADDYSHTFLPMAPTSDENLLGKSYNFGWDDESDGDEFLSVAIYQFKFQNLHANNDLTVTYTYTEGTNVSTKFYLSKEDNLLISDVEQTRSSDGYSTLTSYALKSSVSSNYTSKTTAGDNFTISDTTAATSSNPATMYLYMVIVLVNPANAVSHEVTSSNLSFTLTDAA